MPCGASSTASVSVRWLIPALAAPYGAIRTAARLVSPELTFTITPAVAAATMACASAWHDHMVTNRFCSTMSRRASSSSVEEEPGRAAGERPDVVHRHVETTELGHRAVDHRADGLRVAQVHLHARPPGCPRPPPRPPRRPASPGPCRRARPRIRRGPASTRSPARCPRPAPVTSARFPSSPRSIAIPCSLAVAWP